MSGIVTGIELQDNFSNVLYQVINATNLGLSAMYDMQNVMGGDVDTSGIDGAREALNQATIAADEFVASMKNDIADNTNEQENFNQKLSEGSSQAEKLTNMIKGAVGAYVSIQSVGKVIGVSDDLVQTTARLDAMNDGLQTTNELTQMVYETAQDARGSFGDMADVVARFGNNAKDAFDSSAEVVAFAGLVQKQMTIAGASTTEASNAMLQLSQALGSGVLRGDELNSIFEQAPNLIQSIADYLNVPIGQIRTMASEGELSAEVVKAAIFASADDINEKFEAMPMTWGQVWQSIQNTALMAFTPILNKINEIANSERFQTLVNVIISALYTLSGVALEVIDFMISGAVWISDNWSLIAPVIGGIVAILAVYNAMLIAHQIYTGLVTAAKTIAIVASVAHGAAITEEMLATTGLTKAQLSFNATLYACPIFWIIALIAALIVIIAAVVKAVNYFGNTTYSVMGTICSIVALAGAFIWNLAVGLINSIIQSLWTMFVEPFIGIVEWVLNVCNGGFAVFGGAVANLIGQIISWFLSLGEVVTKIIDAIFGTNWTGGLESLKSSVIAWGKNENAITLSREAPEVLQRVDYTSAALNGYEFGEGIGKKLSGLSLDNLQNGINIDDYLKNTSLDGGAGSLGSGVGDIADNTSAIANNTSDIADGLSLTDEDLKLLREIAEREYVNEFTTAEIKLEMTNNNNISSDMDIDGFFNEMTERVKEAVVSSAEGVHT